MLKLYLLCFVLFVTIFVRSSDCAPEKCEQCVPVDKCKMFGDMSKREQDRWVLEHPCAASKKEDVGVLFGFAPAAKGDYVCCPYSNIWGVESPGEHSHEAIIDNDGHASHEDGYNQDNLHEGQNSHIHKDDSDENVSIEGTRIRHPSRWNSNRPRYNNFYPNEGFAPGNPNFVNRPNERVTNGFNPGRSFNNPGNNFNNPGRNFNNPGNNFNNPGTNFNNPGNNFNNRGNNFNNPGTNFNNPGNNFNNRGNNFNRPSVHNFNIGQCSMSVSPPTSQSGCCGLDVTGDRTGGGSNNYMNRPANSNYWNSPADQPRRFTRDTPESYGISLDNRIAGGKETDVYQYPWTVLLKTTFDYGGRQSTFNCGGSLISSRYILTAAHCVFEKGARVNNIDVYLAEFDKRTYPRDCVNSPEGRKCIDNILLQAEDFVIHPNFDDPRLQNDIALIRLRENVPYTEFTRPICLPPINIDNPEFSNLRLAVAGWGRNGTVPSNVKQSTVVNLVPQRQCSSSYPHLTNKHLCAAGHRGQDTCKGDSGGPLMMLYEGKYYVSGVVSGKRADAPCGTAVPSLYTNVYHYVNWIMNSIRQ